ncbi:hypothetical protein IWZ01DRAFT_512036 [Phyllosticta capitalensis]
MMDRKATPLGYCHGQGRRNGRCLSFKARGGVSMTIPCRHFPSLAFRRTYSKHFGLSSLALAQVHARNPRHSACAFEHCHQPSEGESIDRYIFFMSCWHSGSIAAWKRGGVSEVFGLFHAPLILYMFLPGHCEGLPQRQHGHLNHAQIHAHVLVCSTLAACQSDQSGHWRQYSWTRVADPCELCSDSTTMLPWWLVARTSLSRLSTPALSISRRLWPAAIRYGRSLSTASGKQRLRACQRPDRRRPFAFPARHLKGIRRTRESRTTDGRRSGQSATGLGDFRPDANVIHDETNQAEQEATCCHFSQATQSSKFFAWRRHRCGYGSSPPPLRFVHVVWFSL